MPVTSGFSLWTGTTSPAASSIPARSTSTRVVLPAVIGIDLSTITGGIANSGTIAVSVSATPSVLANGQHVSSGLALGINVNRGVSLSNGLTNAGVISVSLNGASVGSGSFAAGILITSGTRTGQAANTSVSGGVSNSGTIAVVAPGARAVGIAVGQVNKQGLVFGGTVSGGITNSGTITASGKTGIGIALVEWRHRIGRDHQHGHDHGLDGGDRCLWRRRADHDHAIGRRAHRQRRRLGQCEGRCAQFHRRAHRALADAKHLGPRHVQRRRAARLVLRRDAKHGGRNLRDAERRHDQSARRHAAIGAARLPLRLRGDPDLQGHHRGATRRSRATSRASPRPTHFSRRACRPMLRPRTRSTRH